MQQELLTKIQKYAFLNAELKAKEKELNAFYEERLNTLKTELTDELSKAGTESMEYVDTLGNKYVLSNKMPSPSPMVDDQKLREYCNENNIDYTQFIKFKNVSARFTCNFKIRGNK